MLISKLRLNKIIKEEIRKLYEWHPDKEWDEDFGKKWTPNTTFEDDWLALETEPKIDNSNTIYTLKYGNISNLSGSKPLLNPTTKMQVVFANEQEAKEKADEMRENGEGEYFWIVSLRNGHQRFSEVWYER